jgi:RND superfamily putative drug exporter
VVALIVIVALAAPFLSLRLGLSDQGNDPKGTTTRTAYDLLAKGFGPGYNGQLLVVATSTATTPAQLAASTETFANVATAIRHASDVAAVSTPLWIPHVHNGHVVNYLAELTVTPTSAPQDAATTNLITSLRSTTIPRALGSNSAVKVYVGGFTAIFVDFANVISSKLPLFIGVVVLMSFVLLALVFRSIMVPVISAVMNLLSIAGAFGVLTAVFQWGWLGGLIGVSRPGPVDAFLPVMMFAILFGLSMDYQVFLVSRMYEEWLKSGDNRTAVRVGLAKTGKTITAAATIMIVVFVSFILGGERVIKEFGLGLAGGVLIDALVIRMAIVPAVMFFFGKANWWFPKRLDKVIPHIGLELE